MSPAPNPQHHKVSTFFVGSLFQFFKGSVCKVYVAPFDVRLPGSKKQSKDEVVYTVVQPPDIYVICDSEKIDSRGCVGAPGLVIEILSPGNT